ncbi:hypothetical protein HanPI659440_Chr03g0134371 [Helianthus annuus]|nr:hypothetical protein HanPI659440_Chr03g0134371 [Helianthus annuus]
MTSSKLTNINTPTKYNPSSDLHVFTRSKRGYSLRPRSLDLQWQIRVWLKLPNPDQMNASAQILNSIITRWLDRKIGKMSSAQLLLLHYG